MNIISKMSEIASLLDPSLGVELEQDFGNDWEIKLNDAIEQASGNMKYVKINIEKQEINNRNVWNILKISSSSLDTIGGKVTSTSYIPPKGVYSVTSVANFFDDDTARVSHRERYTIDGIGQHPIEGHNYMRSNNISHNSASNVYPDILDFNGEQALSLEVQASSSTGKSTSDLTSGWIILIKLA